MAIAVIPFSFDEPNENPLGRIWGLAPTKSRCL